LEDIHVYLDAWMRELSSERRDHSGARTMCMYYCHNVHDKYTQIIYMLKKVESDEEQRSRVISKLLSSVEKSVEGAEYQRRFDQIRKTVPLVAIVVEHHVQVFHKTKSQSVYEQMCAAQCMLSKLCKLALEHNIKSRFSQITRKMVNSPNQNSKVTKIMLNNLIRNAKHAFRSVDYESNMSEKLDKIKMLKNREHFQKARDLGIRREQDWFDRTDIEWEVYSWYVKSAQHDRNTGSLATMVTTAVHESIINNTRFKRVTSMTPSKNMYSLHSEMTKNSERVEYTGLSIVQVIRNLMWRIQQAYVLTLNKYNHEEYDAPILVARQRVSAEALTAVIITSQMMNKHRDETEEVLRAIEFAAVTAAHYWIWGTCQQCNEMAPDMAMALATICVAHKKELKLPVLDINVHQYDEERTRELAGQLYEYVTRNGSKSQITRARAELVCMYSETWNLACEQCDRIMGETNGVKAYKDYVKQPLLLMSDLLKGITVPKYGDMDMVVRNIATISHYCVEHKIKNNKDAEQAIAYVQKFHTLWGTCCYAKSVNVPNDIQTQVLTIVYRLHQSFQRKLHAKFTVLDHEYILQSIEQGGTPSIAGKNPQELIDDFSFFFMVCHSEYMQNRLTTLILYRHVRKSKLDIVVKGYPIITKHNIALLSHRYVQGLGEFVTAVKNGDGSINVRRRMLGEHHKNFSVISDALIQHTRNTVPHELLYLYAEHFKCMQKIAIWDNNTIGSQGCQWTDKMTYNECMITGFWLSEQAGHLLTKHYDRLDRDVKSQIELSTFKTLIGEYKDRQSAKYPELDCLYQGLYERFQTTCEDVKIRVDMTEVMRAEAFKRVSDYTSGIVHAYDYAIQMFGDTPMSENPYSHTFLDDRRPHLREIDSVHMPDMVQRFVISQTSKCVNKQIEKILESEGHYYEITILPHLNIHERNVFRQGSHGKLSDPVLDRAKSITVCDRTYRATYHDDAKKSASRAITKITNKLDAEVNCGDGITPREMLKYLEKECGKQYSKLVYTAEYEQLKLRVAWPEQINRPIRGNSAPTSIGLMLQHSTRNYVECLLQESESTRARSLAECIAVLIMALGDTHLCSGGECDLITALLSQSLPLPTTDQITALIKAVNVTHDEYITLQHNVALSYNNKPDAIILNTMSLNQTHERELCNEADIERHEVEMQTNECVAPIMMLVQSTEGNGTVSLNMLSMMPDDKRDDVPHEASSSEAGQDIAQSTTSSQQLMLNDDHLGEAILELEDATRFAQEAENMTDVSPLSVRVHINKLEGWIQSCTKSIQTPIKNSERDILYNLKESCENTRTSLLQTLRRVEHLDITMPTPVIPFTTRVYTEVEHDNGAPVRTIENAFRRVTMYERGQGYDQSIAPSNYGYNRSSRVPTPQVGGPDSPDNMDMRMRLEAVEAKLLAQAQNGHSYQSDKGDYGHDDRSADITNNQQRMLILADRQNVPALTNSNFRSSQAQVPVMNTQASNGPGNSAFMSIQPPQAMEQSFEVWPKVTHRTTPTSAFMPMPPRVLTGHSVAPWPQPAFEMTLQFPVPARPTSVSATNMPYDQSTSYISNMLGNRQLPNLTAEQQRIFLLAERQNALALPPWELVAWLEHTSGQSLSPHVPNATLEKQIREMVTSIPPTTKALDYNDLVRHDKKGRAIFTNPEVVWESLDNARNKCTTHGFSYLFHCIENAPFHHVHRANVELMCMFFNKELGTHLGRFNIFMERWALNMPGVTTLQNDYPLFTGCIILSNLYKHVVLTYFQINDLTQDQYFEEKMQKIDVGQQDFQKTIKLIQTTYRMHLFTSGPLSDEKLLHVLNSLKKRFNAYTGTQEQNLAGEWPTMRYSIEQLHMMKKGTDLLLWMADYFQERILTYSNLPTAYAHVLATQSPKGNVQFEDAPTDARRGRPPIRVNTVVADRDICPCGRAGHTKDQCNDISRWKFDSADVDSMLKQFSDPSSHLYRPEIAHVLASRGRGGQGVPSGHICFKCGNTGHLRKDCPVGIGGGSPAATNNQVDPTPTGRGRGLTMG
jgi:hypothetical protein